MARQFQPIRDRRVTKTRPTTEGKGGIQDGILLEKKYCKKQPTAKKGCMREGYPQTLRSPTRSAGGLRPGPATQDCYRTSTRSAGGLRPARGRISVACGNSSAPGPREDNLHAKNLQEI